MILSVVVPVYNAEKYLCQCIDSILNQTLQDIEVVLIDDGSTDKSGMICDEYADRDSRIKVFHQQNMGLIAARKQGVELCDSSYITFVDADDFIDRDSYSNAVDSMKEGIDVICFGIVRYFEWKESSLNLNSSLVKKKYDKRAVNEELIPRMIWNEKDNSFGLDPSLCTKIMKKDLLVESYKLLKDKDFYYGEDSAIIYPLIHMANSVEIKSYSYYYHRQRGQGESPSYIYDKEFFHKLYILYRHLSTYFQNNDLLIKQIEHFFMHSVNLKKKVYGENYQITNYLFPFDQVEKGQKIILYGAGIVGKTYHQQIEKISYCRVVLWVDKNHQKYSALGVKSIENIFTAEYDKIVVAIINADVAEAVREYLVENGIAFEKIVL